MDATLDLIQTLIDIVREEQKMRVEMQTRVAELERTVSLHRDIIVEMPRLAQALSAKEN